MALIAVSIFLTLAKPYAAYAEKASCYFFYNPAGPQQFVERASLTNLVRVDGPWFEVAVPHHKGGQLVFEYKKVKHWETVEELFNGVGLFERNLVEAKLGEYSKYFPAIEQHFFKAARSQDAQMTARIKDLRSLRNKIIDRARAYASRGQQFTFDQLDDFVGVRLILKSNSGILRRIRSDSEDTDIMRKYFAKQLGFNSFNSIVKLDFKGTPGEYIRGKYYRAVYVTIRMPNGVPVEVQMMSENTAIWHRWDHSKVYKATDLGEAEAIRMNVYSRFWLRLINYLEDTQIGAKPFESLQDVFAYVSVPLSLVGNPPEKNISHWLQAIDQRVSQHLLIKNEDRFLGSSSLLSLTKQYRLLNPVSSPHFSEQNQ